MSKFIFKIGLLCAMLSGAMGACFAQSFSVQRAGNGKQAVVLIPGFACSGDVWRQTVDVLQDDHTCYVLTMPGFAGVQPEENPSFEHWAEQISDFIREENIDHPILIGHSMGGGLALKIASMYPDLLKGIIVVDALPCLAAIYNPDFQAREVSDDESTAACAGLPEMGDDRFRRQAYISAMGLTTDSLRYDDLVEWSMSSDRRTYYKMFRDYSHVDLRLDMKRITVPTLVLLEHPFKNMAGMVESQFGNRSNMRLAYAEKGLHFIMFDDREWYIRQVMDFLGNLRS